MIKTTISEKAATVQPLPAKMEDEPQHTPGPWEAYKDESPDLESCSYHIRTQEDDPTFIAAIYPYQPKGCTEEANARLIAAAPELLRCLFHLEKELQMSFDDVPAGVDAWMAEARAAIAAAKGGQK